MRSVPSKTPFADTPRAPPSLHRKFRDTLRVTPENLPVSHTPRITGHTPKITRHPIPEVDVWQWRVRSLGLGWNSSHIFPLCSPRKCTQWTSSQPKRDATQNQSTVPLLSKFTATFPRRSKVTGQKDTARPQLSDLACAAVHAKRHCGADSEGQRVGPSGSSRPRQNWSAAGWIHHWSC